MQLIPLSRITAVLLCTATVLPGDDVLSVQYMFYDEEQERTQVSAPSVMLQSDLSHDYTLQMGFVYDDVTGATPNYYDAQSGASAYSRGRTTADNVRYGNVPYYERRYVYSLGLTHHQENGDEASVIATYSNEFDYRSYDAALHYQHYLDSNKNSMVDVGAAYEYNAHLVWCYQNSACSDAQSGASARLDSHQLQLQLGASQVLSPTLRVEASLFTVLEQGYLNNPYLNVIKGFDSRANVAYVENETRPTRRNAAGATLGVAYAMNETLSLQAHYRYYYDDWRVDSHTISPQIFWQCLDWLRIEGLWRYYTQSSAFFYAADAQTFTRDVQFASSDYRLSVMHSHYVEGAMVFNVSEATSLNIGYGRYSQSTGLRATIWYSGLEVGF